MIRPSTTQYGIRPHWHEPRGKSVPRTPTTLTSRDHVCFKCTLPVEVCDMCDGGTKVGPCPWRRAKLAMRLIKVFWNQEV